MKKINISLLIVLTLMIFVTPVYALECKAGNYGSDECWTTGQLRTNDNTQALKTGTVMVYDFTTPTEQGNSADEADFYVRGATTSDQGNIVAGVLQKDASSGDRVQLLVRGHGQVRVVREGTVTSGDRLYLYGTKNGQRGTVSADVSATSQAASKDKSIAYALENFSTAATGDAYITIV